MALHSYGEQLRPKVKHISFRLQISVEPNYYNVHNVAQLNQTTVVLKLSLICLLLDSVVGMCRLAR